ncbi:Fe-S cluster assembly protein SufD [Ignavibacterium album JCM 16511]|uniref:Fe-S cluster assembly protein SufD n=1 Tax=Ignavibacterium album (strain DSM 19864 / JCM 16511 / NBRC 101810 / Mat9-16) TaxID=945713 RepID=I0ANP1_IGNAJ|nr:Fe-S cluster assembly protein SufD [Ignavibacterium album]AFH50598.1 Fe-S cluster assembly protein SufD [Ignavibacterium album JCM 16511]
MSNIDFKQWFIENFQSFEKSLNGGKTESFHRIRKDALSKFSSIKIPTIKDEEWKYTNISSIIKHNFSVVPPKKDTAPEIIGKFLFDKLEHHLLVFINGEFRKDLSRLNELPDRVKVGSLSAAIKNNHPVLLKHFGKYAEDSNNLFTALNSAFTKDGAFILVPKGIAIEDPIHIIFLNIAGEEKFATQPRNLFIAEENSQITIIEHYASDDEGIYLSNAVTEIFVCENAVVDHIKLQEESTKAFHIGRMEVDQERSSKFASHLISTGAEFSRNEFTTRFNGEGGESMLNGLFLIKDEQFFDAHTMIDHAKPHCNSHEHYKGILQDKARGVFNGKVMVRPDAQKTNAFQENNSILLSDDAVMNSKPQLEIFADDVKCSHGATVGKLDEDAKFYLKTRGIGEEAATAMLIHAFASDVIKTIKIESLRDYLEEIISKRFNQ